MVRRLYQATLLALQLALLVEVAPQIAIALALNAAFGAFPHGWPAIVHVASIAAAVVGGALTLAFPGIALLRHRQRGTLRFGGLPDWAVVLSLAGGTLFALGLAVNSIVPFLAPDARMAAVLTARPALDAGIALMAAGVLWAELLRRSIGVPSIVLVSRPAGSDRIEVVHPKDLSTVQA
jgi:hypothetical protein